jgi:hypothetical protein
LQLIQLLLEVHPIQVQVLDLLVVLVVVALALVTAVMAVVAVDIQVVAVERTLPVAVDLEVPVVHIPQLDLTGLAQMLQLVL